MENRADIERLVTVERRIDAMEQARELQATIYEARLEGLNESRAYERDAIATMVPRELYEQSQAVIHERIRELEKRSVGDRAARGALLGALALGTTLGGTAVALLSFLTR